MRVRDWFITLTGWLTSALSAASANGVTDDRVRCAYWLAKQAAAAISGDDDASALRRAWVLAEMAKRGIPESIARFALEAAVQMLKREVLA